MTVQRAEGFIGVWKTSPPLRAVVAAIGSALGLEFKGSKEHRSDTPKRGVGEYLEGLASAGLSVERVKRNG